MLASCSISTEHTARIEQTIPAFASSPICGWTNYTGVCDSLSSSYHQERSKGLSATEHLALKESEKREESANFESNRDSIFGYLLEG